MALDEFTSMTEAELEEVEKKRAFAPKFTAGENVIMLVSEVSYDNEKDTYVISLEELSVDDNDGEKRLHADWVYLKQKDGSKNGISVAHMRGLHMAIYGFKAFPTPDKLEGAVVGVEFKHDIDKKDKEKIWCKVKEYFAVDSSWKDISSQSKQVYTDSEDGW